MAFVLDQCMQKLAFREHSAAGKVNSSLCLGGQQQLRKSVNSWN